MGAQRLLISDLDGTLLGDPAGEARFVDWARTARDRWRVVYATGRTLASVLELVEAGRLIAPDAVLSNVGTEIHDPDGAAWADWPPGGHAWDVDRIAATMAAIPGIEPQPADAQSPEKSSCHANDLSDVALHDIRASLERAGQSVTVVYSAQRFLDILPGWGGKARAARFVADAWGFGQDQVVVAGDSGNDLDLLGSGMRAVIVANAGAELAGLRGERIHRSDRTFADGVLDGIERWEGIRAGAASRPAPPLAGP